MLHYAFERDSASRACLVMHGTGTPISAPPFPMHS